MSGATARQDENAYVSIDERVLVTLETSDSDRMI